MIGWPLFGTRQNFCLFMVDTTEFMGTFYPAFGNIQKTDCDIFGLLYILAENGLIGENSFISQEAFVFKLFTKNMKLDIAKYFCKNYTSGICTKHKITYLHGEKITFYDRKKLLFDYKTVYRIKQFPQVYLLIKSYNGHLYFDPLAILWNTLKFIA